MSKARRRKLIMPTLRIYHVSRLRKIEIRKPELINVSYPVPGYTAYWYGKERLAPTEDETIILNRLISGANTLIAHLAALKD